MLEIDNTQIYDSITGETVGEIENLTEKQLKEILDIKKDFPKEAKIKNR